MDTQVEPRFVIDPAVIGSAVGCEKGHSCLVDGPKCRVMTRLPSDAAVIVCCKEIGSCAYKTGHYEQNGEQETVCSCPVRMKLLWQYGI